MDDDKHGKGMASHLQATMHVCVCVCMCMHLLCVVCVYCMCVCVVSVCTGHVVISAYVLAIYGNYHIMYTCSQKEHILNDTVLCRYVVCDHTGLVQHNLSNCDTIEHSQWLCANLSYWQDSVSVGVVWSCHISIGRALRWEVKLHVN